MDINNEIETIINSLPEDIKEGKYGICLTDPNKKDNPLIYVNNYFCEMFGYDYDEVIGTNCRFLQGIDKYQDSKKDIKNAINNKIPITKIFRNYKKDGTFVYIELTITPIMENNKLKFFLGIQKDLSDMANTEF